MGHAHPVKEAPGVTGTQQVTNKDGEQINLQDQDSTPAPKVKKGQKEDTAGTNVPGKENGGGPNGTRGDLNSQER